MVPLNHKIVRLKKLYNKSSFSLKYFQFFQEDHYFVTVFLLTFFRKKVRPRWPSDEREFSFY